MQVAEFFSLNAKILMDAENVKQQLENKQVMSLLEVPAAVRNALLKKHGGNVNAVMDEVRVHRH